MLVLLNLTTGLSQSEVPSAKDWPPDIDQIMITAAVDHSIFCTLSSLSSSADGGGGGGRPSCIPYSVAVPEIILYCTRTQILAIQVVSNYRQKIIVQHEHMLLSAELMI